MEKHLEILNTLCYFYDSSRYINTSIPLTEGKLIKEFTKIFPDIKYVEDDEDIKIITPQWREIYIIYCQTFTIGVSKVKIIDSGFPTSTVELKKNSLTYHD